MSDLCESIQRFGKGIGNSCRYRLVQILTAGPRTVSQLVEELGQSQPAVSQHLKVLKEYGLVSDERCGQEVVYSLNTVHILSLLKNLTEAVTKNNADVRTITH